jgi:hypothetical protein
MWIFRCRLAEVRKVESDISRTLRYDPQYKDAVGVDSCQMRLPGHAMRHILHINLRSVLN